MRIGYRQVRLILYASVLFVPFTSLRFGFIGLGEILFLIGLVLMFVLNRGTFRIRGELAPVVRFWMIYLGVITLGFAYNVFVLDFKTGSLGGAVFDFGSYVFVLGAMMLLGDDRLYRGSSPEGFFKVVFSLWAVAFSVLYFLSLFASSIFGYPLRYYAYFSPLVDNIHQAAMVTAAMPFLMWHLALRRGSLIGRAFYVATGGLFVVMALESGSTKALMAVVVGAAVTVLVFLWRVIPADDRASRLVMVGLVSVGAVFVSLSNFDLLVELGGRFFQEHDGHSARESLYKIGFDIGMESFLVGHGPGQHVSLGGDGNFSDAHNSVLTLFLQGGVLALVAFGIAVRRVASKMTYSFFLLGSLAAILMYFLGGDILRRLPIWIVIAGLVYLSASRSQSFAGRAPHRIGDDVQTPKNH